MIIEKYPSFRPIELSDKPAFDKIFKNNPPEISEFTFTNIYAWRSQHKITVSSEDNFLILKSGKTVSGHEEEFADPIGEGDKRDVIEKILDDTGGVFARVPEKTAELFYGDKRLEVRYDADYSDYLYRTKDLVLLEGKKYDGKRNLIKKFKSTHEYEYIPIDDSSAKDTLAFMETWCFTKDCDSIEGLKDEKQAVSEMIANFSNFKLVGGMIKIKGKTLAIAVAERLNMDTVVLHVLKADPKIKGLYQTMLNEFLFKEAMDFEFVNLEEDLGIEGLRKAKLSYYPVRMIRKYTIRLAG